MFQSDDLIYIQMQKCASSHIASLLPHFFAGQRLGKHNAASTAQINSDRYFISSIRNPWDWYLSLWTFGIKGKGGVRTRLLKGPTFGRLINNPTIGHYVKMRNDAAKFTELYADDHDVSAFRTWLKLINKPENQYLFKKEHNAISKICGLFTFRYLSLCCQNMDNIKQLKQIDSLEDLRNFDKQNCYIDFFIRQESLEDDFCKAIEKIRALTPEEKQIVYSAKKTNTSKRSLQITDYYDQESIDSVEQNEQFIIDKFNYSCPTSG